LLRNATIGALAWTAVAVSALTERGPFGLIETLFLLAPLVLVPLALDGLGPRLGALAPWQLGAALAAAASFLLPRGPAAAALAAVWLAFTLALAREGLRHLHTHGVGDPAEAAIAAGPLLVPVGGGWLTASRLGLEPMGFTEPIVLLTAVHFHYTAFVAPLLAGFALRALGPSPARRAIVAGLVLGTPLVAAGITFAPVLELLGALAIAGALVGLAVAILTAVAPRAASRAARVLLTVSALALLPAMALAVAYAWGRAWDRPLVALSDVARIHGPANALGFGLCGLLGFALDRSARR
jgi:energy-converting hydrogenase Eha subunit A